jgi:hypothetical protein
VTPANPGIVRLPDLLLGPSTVNLIAVAAAMAVAAAIPAVLPRLPLPGVVLEIVIGAIIDPQVLGSVRPGAALNFPADFGFGMLFPGSAACPLRSREQAQSVLPSDLASSLHQGFKVFRKILDLVLHVGDHRADEELI